MYNAVVAVILYEGQELSIAVIYDFQWFSFNDISQKQLLLKAREWHILHEIIVISLAAAFTYVIMSAIHLTTFLTWWQKYLFLMKFVINI